MKNLNLENYGVEELNTYEKEIINGGEGIGYESGKALAWQAGPCGCHYEAGHYDKIQLWICQLLGL